MIVLLSSMIETLIAINEQLLGIELKQKLTATLAIIIEAIKHICSAKVYYVRYISPLLHKVGCSYQWRIKHQSWNKFSLFIKNFLLLNCGYLYDVTKHKDLSWLLFW